MNEDRLDKLLNFLKTTPNDSFLLFAIAKEYETRQQIDQALKHYLLLKENDPKYIGLYYHLAKIYEHIQEDILALGIYKEGVALAKELGDYHALSELNNAKTNLELQLGN